jgi:hypothetical protein
MTQSLLMRERGLKLFLTLLPAMTTMVAPHAGAWIETSARKAKRPEGSSLLMRERGLKHG